MHSKLVVFAMLGLGVGCGGAGTTGPLGQAESNSAGDALGTGIEDGAATFGPQNASASSSSFAPLAPCVTLTGDTTDTDQDNIPADATLTFNCSQTRLGFTGTETGTETIMDTQPTAIAWAFSGTADLQSSLTGPAGASITAAWTGSLVATQGSATGPFNLARMLDVTTVAKSATNVSTTVFETANWTLTFTPTATWTPGGVVVDGTLSASGSWDVTVGNSAASATIATGTPLAIDPTCATRVTAGVITATYEGAGLTHTITVTWTGCGQHTVTYAES